MTSRWVTDARDAHVVDPLARTSLTNYFRSKTSRVGARVTFINGCVRERVSAVSAVSTTTTTTTTRLARNAKRERDRSTDGWRDATDERRTDAPIKMYWIDYDGKMRGYDAIAAGGRKTQNTYRTHAWTATTLDEGKRRQRCVLNDALVHVVQRNEDESDESDEDIETWWNRRGEARKATTVRVERPRYARWTPETHASCDSEAFKAAVVTFLMCHKRLEREYVGLGTLPNELLLLICERAAPLRPIYPVPIDTYPISIDELAD